MSEHTPLTEAGVSPAIKAQNPDLETSWKTIAWWQQTCDYWHAEAQKGYALRDALAARTSTATADTDPGAWVCGVCDEGGPAHQAGGSREGCVFEPVWKPLAATADTGLRERVEALADGWDESSASGHPDCDIDADCVACAAAELRAVLDATAAPTTDTGARDE